MSPNLLQDLNLLTELAEPIREFETLLLVFQIAPTSFHHL